MTGHHRGRQFPQGGGITKWPLQFAAFVITLATYALVLTPPPARAVETTKPVAAGDAITQGGYECTLGYVYRVQGHTMGVSAGHCASSDGGVVEDTDAGVIGRTVSATFLPNKTSGQPPQKDWWLIDFGDVAWSDRIAHTNYRVITYVNARESDWVCHYGVTSAKEVCGFVSKVDSPLITVTQVGEKGDSGGPTYIKISDTMVAMVGLWQGHFTDPYPGGYVMSLPAALDYFRYNSA
ncbi:MAG: hypothetical protein AB7G47_19410 [Mycolicibacterium sp.]|uniref:hypothetical protein n=1 Tax=Mycolicibacterium sp. TaxID=2320850 RepID=UPI003D130856